MTKVDIIDKVKWMGIHVEIRIFVTLALLSSIMMQSVVNQLSGNISIIPYESHAADSMWIEPSSIDYSIENASIGTRFNVTVWLNITSENIFTWQVALLYNRTHLRGIDAAFTAGSTSQFMQGHSTTTAGPEIDTSFLGNGSVLAFESCIAEDTIPAPQVGSLLWIEFEIVSEPSAGSGTLTSEIDITTYYPARTWAKNFDITNIPITTYNGTYTFILGVPVITDVNRTPMAPDFDENVVVSAIIVDDVGVDEALLSYTFNVDWHNVSMQEYDPLFNATIPAQPYGTVVDYKVYANNTMGNWAESDSYYYVVTDSSSPEIINVTWKGTAPYPFIPSDRVRVNEAALITANISKHENASAVTYVKLSYRVNEKVR